jgi:histidine triad (HIT) family protein
MLNKEQSDLLRRQLASQIDATFPADKKEFAKKQLLNMDDSQLEAFLKQNKLIKPLESPPEQSQGEEQQCIFCAILSGTIPSYKIDENKDAIAILEINPISKGHVIIIPKQHVESQAKLPQSAFSLAKKLIKKLKSKLKAKDVKMFFVNVMGHETINVLPVYKEETITSPRTQADKKDLEKLQKKLQKKPTKKKAHKPKKLKAGKKSVKPKEKKLWLPKRIP